MISKSFSLISSSIFPFKSVGWLTLDDQVGIEGMEGIDILGIDILGIEGMEGIDILGIEGIDILGIEGIQVPFFDCV